MLSDIVEEIGAAKPADGTQWILYSKSVNGKIILLKFLYNTHPLIQGNSYFIQMIECPHQRGKSMSIF